MERVMKLTGTKRIHRTLVDSQKRLAAERTHSQGIFSAAEEQEAVALKDVVRLGKALRKAEGPDREIAEAEYFDALQRKKRAAQAGSMARGTLGKLRVSK